MRYFESGFADWRSALFPFPFLPFMKPTDTPFKASNLILQ
jgi:hypothetical protein